MSMHGTDLKLRTAYASLALQTITGILTALAFVVLPSDENGGTDLQTIAALELSSQILEFMWYAYVVFVYKQIITWTRYLDWFFSTPLMLVSTALFFLHRQSLPSSELLRGEGLGCLVCNAFMLFCGYIVEADIVPHRSRLQTVAMGSVFFVGSFTFLATFIDEDDAISIVLFWIIYVVWAGYGLAALLPDTPKNVSYNILDLVSKNMYGIFIFAYSASRS